GILGGGIALSGSPAFATQQTDLEYVGTEVSSSYENNSDAEDEEVLEPIYIDGDTVDIEIFGRPEPEVQTEVFETTLQQERKVGGVEVIQFTVPAE
ncbi:MAG: hypothetical protein AAFQ89_11290, partial [Cyanobacteria bacterium J06626_18]